MTSVLSGCGTSGPKSIKNLKFFNYNGELNAYCRLVKSTDYKKDPDNVFKTDANHKKHECIVQYRSKKNKMVPNYDVERIYTWIAVLYAQCRKWKDNADQITVHRIIKKAKKEIK